MFASRDRARASDREGRPRLAAGVVDLAFTDRYGEPGTSSENLDLRQSRHGRGEQLPADLGALARAFGVAAFAGMRQVHGAEVRVVRRAGLVPQACDGLVSVTPGLALMVRGADCVPVLLADVATGIVGAAHAGRVGLVAGVVPATVAKMRGLGASTVEAWVGPHACGGCYEVPAAMRDDVAAAAPASYACTTWGTSSIDLGAGVEAQLERAGCLVHDRSRCTVESRDLHSYRRDGELAGRIAGLIVWRPDSDE